MPVSGCCNTGTSGARRELLESSTKLVSAACPLKVSVVVNDRADVRRCGIER